MDTKKCSNPKCKNPAEVGDLCVLCYNIQYPFPLRQNKKRPAKTEALIIDTQQEDLAPEIPAVSLDRQKLQKLTGTRQLQGTPFETLAARVRKEGEITLTGKEWVDFKESSFPGCTIFNRKTMARRYGVSLPNFRRLAEDRTCPAPIVKYGNLWAARLSALDRWWYNGAIKKRAEGNAGKAWNSPRLKNQQRPSRVGDDPFMRFSISALAWRELAYDLSPEGIEAARDWRENPDID